VILPVLRARRRSRLDVVVLSHPHPDHYLGLAAALPSVAVGEFWDTGQGRAEGAGPEYHALIRELEARGVAVRGPSELCGARHAFGGANVEVLAPCPSFSPGVGANDNSFVFRVRHGARAVLFMGDAERFEEETVLAEHSRDLRADLLKTGHHGSRTSTSEALLAAVRPSVATISCGIRNRFGHPHPATLTTLAAASVFAVRTDVMGSVEWRTDGDSVVLSAFTRGVDDDGFGPFWYRFRA
jgi:competence protein ComEC